MVRNYYHLNTILEDYRIKNIISKINFEIEKHSIIQNTKDMQFTILPKYVILKSTTTITSILLKDTGSNNLLADFSKQSRSYIG